MSRPVLDLTPAPWVEVTGEGIWVHRLFRTTVVAPPPVVDLGCPPEEVDRAELALQLGFASARSRGRWWHRLHAQLTLPVQASRATALPPDLGVLTHLTREFLRVHALVIAFVAVLGVAGAAAGLPVVDHVAGCLLLVLAATLVHELGHACAFRCCAPRQPAVFVMRRQSPRLVWPSMSYGRDLLVIVAGPAAVTLLLGAVLPFWPTTAPEVVVAAVWALANLATLLMPHGDGAQLRLVLRTGRPASPARGAGGRVP